MKVKLKWEHSYTQTDSYESEFDVADGLAPEEIDAAAMKQAMDLDWDSLARRPIESFDGESVVELVSCEVVGP